MSPVSSASLKQQAIGLLQSNRVVDAAALLQSAVDADPADAESWCLLGAVQGMLNKHEDAIRACREATKLKPDYAEAWCNLGASQHDLKQFDHAIASLSEAVRLRPQYLGALYNLGNSFKEAGRSQEAIDCYQKALSLQPSVPAYINLGTVYERIGKTTEAIDCYRSALAMDQKNAETHNNLGNVLVLAGDDNAAYEHYQQALALNADYAEAHNNLGAFLSKRGHVAEAIKHYRRAVEIRPTFAEAWSNIGAAESSRGEIALAQQACLEATRLQPDNPTFASNWLFTLNYDASLTAEEIFKAHANWGIKFAAAQTPPAKPVFDGTRCIRVGYISPDLRGHPTARFISSVLANHNRSVVEVFCYANVARPDATTARLQSLTPHWRSVYGKSAGEAADMIKADKIDILVDLAGHGADNRLDVMALRPAPVQASWLGYPATTGISAVDYYLSDPFLAPPDADKRFTEKLIRLPLFCCYEPPADAPAVDSAPSRRTGYVTFGSFHNPAKINDRVVKLWASVLARVDNTRLLMQSAAFADEETQGAFRARFNALGISADRLQFIGGMGFTDYLKLHGQVDIVLDTFPWNGHTTNCHTLWMGVPVVTLVGQVHATRMAADLLHAIELPDLIAQTTEDYVERAVALAQDAGTLTRLREELRGRMQRSPLCNGPLFTRQLEHAYRDMLMR